MTKRVLLCDDELHILRAAEFKLKRAGLDVVCAADGEEGWEQITRCCPDALVTDYQMPRLDGRGLVERVRNTPATAHLPIIMLTAKGFELRRDELEKEWDVAAVLAKPFSPRELLARVQALLDDVVPATPAESLGQ